MRKPHVLVPLLLALVLAFALARGRAAHATSYAVWRPDMSHEEDSLPPSRPSVRLVAVHRAKGTRLSYMKFPRASYYEVTPPPGAPDTLVLVEERSSSDANGYLEMLVRDRDDRTLPERLAWRARVVAGSLPYLSALPFPASECGQAVASPNSGPTGWCTLYVSWKDWVQEQGNHRDSLYAGIVLTCLDRAANESEPSDTVWIYAPAR